MKKWLFATLCLLIIPVAVLFSGCSTEKDVVIRVSDGYVQWSYEDEDSWTNVISIDDIKSALGDAYQGAQGEKGEAGVNGRQVEFSKNETHILWRYVGDDNWNNLVALSEIKGKDGEITVAGPKHTVTFDSNGGTEVDSITNVTHLSSISRPATPTRSGYMFDGWYSDGDLWNFAGCLVSKDITLKAKWNPLFTYTLGKDSENIQISGLTSYGQTLEKICFSSNIDGHKVESVDCTLRSNYLEEVAFEDGIENIVFGADGCTNLKSIVLPDSCKSMNLYLSSDSKNFVFNQYKNGQYLGTKTNPYFFLQSIEDLNVPEFEIHSDCEIVYSNFYSGSAFDTTFDTIKFDGTTNQFKNKTHFVEQSTNNSGKVFLVVCTNGQFFSSDKYYECTYSTGETKRYKIGSSMVYQSNMVSVIIPDGVTSIGKGTFQYCSGLTSITIPSGVTSIGAYAFSDCSGLTSITIPNSVTSIGSSAFSRCSGLTRVNITDFSAWLNIDFSSMESNPLYHANHLYLNGKKVTEIVIEEGVTKINDYVLYEASALTSITIPNSVTSIGGWAFYGCSGLASITIPNSVTSIGAYAFSHCYALSSIIIPESVTSIGKEAFYWCSGLTSITIPSSVTSIGVGAFYGCSAKIFCEQSSEPLDWLNDWAGSSSVVYWLRETEPEEEGKFWHYVDGKPEIW